jgi:hypothetical protein
VTFVAHRHLLATSFVGLNSFFKMKRMLLIAVLAAGLHTANAQGLTGFSISLEEVNISGLPALQSYAWAKTTDGKWLLLCGRTDGLHDHRPPFSFPSAQANDDIWVVDPNTKQVWSAPINALPIGLKNALTATNAQFQQEGDVLYIVGGYGVDFGDNQHKTYSYVTSVDVTPLANAIINNQTIVPHFKQITDSRMKVTGGYMSYLNNQFYLVCGQTFDGRYNPHNGGSFTQTYTEAIKKFNITPSGNTLSITNYTETIDAANLHRRDYNMVEQIFPNGDTGLTVFSGVFQPVLDIPHFNTVDVTPAGHTVRSGFNQLLNQYHTAHMPAYDAANNLMHTLFFGGIGMYHFDAGNNLVGDSLVPFVKTISMVTRFGNDSMVEYALPIQMPGYLGASAEFIPSDSVSLLANAIVDLNDSNGKILAGYIVGGIQSTDPNIFMFASSGTSAATNRVFKVYLQPGSFGFSENALTAPFHYHVYPNPTRGNITLELDGKNLLIELLDLGGEVLQSVAIDDARDGKKIQLSLEDEPAGVYLIRISSANFTRVEQVVKN